MSHASTHSEPNLNKQSSIGLFEKLDEQQQRVRALYWFGSLFTLIIGAIAISVGSYGVDFSLPMKLLSSVFQTEAPAQSEAGILFIGQELRLPRVVMTMIVGAVLSMCGAAMQGVFRNPMADPSLLGISGGAAVAAAAVIVFGGGIFTTWVGAAYVLPFAAFAGSLLSMLMIVRMGYRKGYLSIVTLLLAGIAMNALASTGLGYLSFIADDSSLRLITYWTMGSFGGASWQVVMALLPFCLLSTILIYRQREALNLLLMGESEARYLGINVKRVKNTLLLAVAFGVGASVSATGMIAFVGLVVPHLVRKLVGPDYRTLLPGSALIGAILLTASDIVSRLIVAPAELPIGIVTSAIGAPFFLFLLLRRGSVQDAA